MIFLPILGGGDVYRNCEKQKEVSKTRRENGKPPETLTRTETLNSTEWAGAHRASQLFEVKEMILAFMAAREKVAGRPLDEIAAIIFSDSFLFS